MQLAAMCAVLGGCPGVAVVSDDVPSAPVVEPQLARSGDPLTCTGPGAPPVRWWMDGAEIGRGEVLLETLSAGSTVHCSIGRDAERRDSEPVTVQPGNFLVVIIDDVGTEDIGVYGDAPTAPPTPHLDALAARGMLFRRAYAQPTCSPTRAALLTGRYPSRYQLGAPIFGDQQYELPRDAPTLPWMLGKGTGGAYASAAVGKWHLSTPLMSAGMHPLHVGFDSHAGSLGNISSYFSFAKYTDGVSAQHEGYAVTDTVDEAIERIATLPEPWLVWVGLNAAHVPLHAPPRELHTASLDSQSSDAEKYDAMVEAMDTELGRLFDALPADRSAHTTTWVWGDNGTETRLLEPEEGPGGKGSMRETGVRVPLIVAGPPVASPGAESLALVDATDLYATVAELAGLELPEVPMRDSISFAHVLRDPLAPSGRAIAYAERFKPNGSVDGPWEFCLNMARDDRYKVIRRGQHPDELYDLQGLLREGEDLLLGVLTAREEEAWERLAAVIDEREICR